jgi:hypothetical protein
MKSFNGCSQTFVHLHSLLTHFTYVNLVIENSKGMFGSYNFIRL